MLSVVIAARDDGRRLVATLSALVPGAVAGLVREVVVADSGSSEVAEIADIAGCRVTVFDAPTGARLKAAAAAARGPWLLFLTPGCVPDGNWIGEIRGFIETSELAGRADKIAAVFRRAPMPGTASPALMEAMWLALGALGAQPHPEQGLLITKGLYDRLGGHGATEEAESEMLRRLGRRRIATLRSAAAAPRP